MVRRFVKLMTFVATRKHEKKHENLWHGLVYFSPYLWLNPKGFGLEKEKESFCVVFTYSLNGREKLGSFMSQFCTDV